MDSATLLVPSLPIRTVVSIRERKFTEPRRWFALTVRPRFDKAVARTLEMKGYETCLPLYRRRQLSETHSVGPELPLFPGYVCCRFDARKRLSIMTTPGVIRVVGFDDTPIALPDIEVVSLQIVMRARMQLQPFPFVESGQRVRIQGGPLAGVEGIVTSFRQTLKLVLSISVLRKSILLEIGREQMTVSDCISAEPSYRSKGD